jgi:hypothetical protein
MSANPLFGYTTYPENTDLLQREIGKLLKDEGRRANIAQVRNLIKSHLHNGSNTKIIKRRRRAK